MIFLFSDDGANLGVEFEFSTYYIAAPGLCFTFICSFYFIECSFFHCITVSLWCFEVKK